MHCMHMQSFNNSLFDFVCTDTNLFFVQTPSTASQTHPNTPSPSPSEISDNTSVDTSDDGNPEEEEEEVHEDKSESAAVVAPQVPKQSKNKSNNKTTRKNPPFVQHLTTRPKRGIVASPSTREKRQRK